MLPRFAITALLLVSCGGSGAIEVTDAWVGDMPPGVETAALYLTISNGTGVDDRLVSVSSERCEAVELHDSQLGDDQVMRMRPATAETLTVPAGGELTMRPGSLHLMCTRPVSPFVDGDTVPFDVTLESGDTISGIASVESR